MDVNRLLEEDENACPDCGAEVVLTGDDEEPPANRQTGRCSAGHRVERHLGLEQTKWRLQR